MALNNLGLGLLFTAKDLASGVMGKVRNGFAQTRDEFGKFGARSQTVFRQFGTGVATMGAGLAGVALFGSAIEASGRFSQQLGLIRQVVDEAAFSTEDLKKQTDSLATTYGVDALQQAKGFNDIFQAGITDSAKAVGILTAANRMALGGNTALASTVDVLTSALNNYKATGLTAEHASDVLFKTADIGKTSIAELASSLGEVAPSASALGVSFEDLGATIGALTQAGIKTPQAITAINSMLANISKPSKEAADEAKKLGIQFNATALKTMGLSGVFKQLQGNTKITDDSLTNLFGSIDGFKAAAKLAANNGVALNEAVAEIGKAAGKTQRAVDLMTGSYTHQKAVFGALFGADGTVRRSLGEALEPLAAKVLSVMNRIGKAFGDIPRPLRETIVRVVAFSAAVISLVGAVAAGVAAFKIAGAALATFGGGAVGGVVAALGPAILLIGVLTASAFALKHAYDKNLGGIGDKIRAIVDQIKVFGEAVFQLFTQGGFSGRVREAFLEGYETGPLNFAIQVYLLFNRVKNFLTGVWDGVKNVFSNSGAFDALVQAFSAVQDALGLFENDVEASGKAFDSFGRKGFKVGEIIGAVAEVVVFAISAALNLIAGFIAAWELVKPALSAVGDELNQLVSEIGEFVSELTGASTAGLSAADVFKFVGALIANVLGVAFSIVAGSIRNVIDVFRSFALVVGGVVDIVAGILSGDGDRAWNGFKRLVLGVVSAIVDAVMFIPMAIAQAVDAIAKLAGTDLGLGEKLRDFKNGLKGDLGAFMNVQKGGAFVGQSVAIPTSSPPVPTTAPSSLNTPALASVGPANASFDPAQTAAAASAAAQAAVSKVPPAQVAVIVELDGDNLASKVTTRQGSAAAASFAPVSVAD